MSNLGRLFLAGLSEALVPLFMLLVLTALLLWILPAVARRFVLDSIASELRGIALAVIVCSDVASNLTQLAYNGLTNDPAYHDHRDLFLYSGVLLALTLLVAWCLLPGLLGEVALLFIGVVTGLASTAAFAGISDAFLTWLGTTISLLAIVVATRLIAKHLGMLWLFRFFGVGLLIFVVWTAVQLLYSDHWLTSEKPDGGPSPTCSQPKRTDQDLRTS